MSRVLLCGAFGQDNPGDDALLAAFLAALRDHDVAVAGPPETAGQEQVRIVAPTARGVGTALRSVDAVVVAGGTVFKTLHPSTGRHPLGLLARTRLLQATARANGVPFALVGVGAADLGSRAAARLARSIAGRADLLVLRDEESASVLRGVGAPGPFRVGADPAWTILDTPSVRPVRERREVVVAISHLAASDAGRLTERLVHLVEPLVAQGVPVALQPWQADHGADSELARAVHRRVGQPGLVTVVERPRSLHDAVEAFRGAAAVIGLRHHALVAAAEARCPFLAVAHEPKLAALARRLGEPAVPTHAPAAVLARAAVELLSREPADARLVAREKAAADRTMRLLRVLVSGGEHDELLDRDRLELTPNGTPW